MMGFPIGDILSIKYFALAGAQTCQLFENNLMATPKRSKVTHSDLWREFNLLNILISKAIQLKGI